MNYNTLMNKPTINYRELIGDNTVTEVGGITEEQFNTLLNTDLSSYYTKAQIDELFARSFIYKEKSGSIVTFDCPTNTNGIAEVTSEIVAVQSGTGDPSPTNVRPITGWSAVNRYRTGINVWDEEWKLGNINPENGQTVVDTNKICSKNFISVIGGETYYINKNYSNMVCYDANKNYIASVTYTVAGSGYLLEIPENAAYIKFSMPVPYGTTYNNDISINYPSTDTSYHAYNGTTYTTQLKDGQGNPLTCYGGELSNENGVQSLKNGCIIIDMGTINWVYSNGVFGSNQVYPTLLTNGKLMCSQYKWNSTPNIAPSRLEDGEISASPYFNTGSVMVKDTRYSDVTAFKTAMSGVMLVYELETPQQIPQDNLAIASDEGTNNLWADSGDITVKALDKIIQE